MKRLPMLVLLSLAALPATAREIPRTPQPLAEDDETGIVSTLGIDPERLSWLWGFRFPHQDRLLAVAGILDETLAPDLAEGRETLCFRESRQWRCRTDGGLPLLFASLPDDCPDIGPATLNRGPILRVLRGGHPSPEGIRAILDLVCRAEPMADAWRAGHRLASLRRNSDGELEIATQAPSATPWGAIFIIELDCVAGDCQATIARLGSWTT